MRAVIVSVDYNDLLSVSLPYNAGHFESVTIITSTADAPNVRAIAHEHGADVLATDLFFADGARFNKWRALEWALDVIGRTGWLVFLDADVLWPKVLPPFDLIPGKLYAPLRRMAPWPLSPIPPEIAWSRLYPIHRNVGEWAGYSQIYHASDTVLGPPPWHDVTWLHAGGADSFFQEKWHPSNKIRPPFEVLHMGEAGANWHGRSTPRADGSVPPDAEAKRQRTLEMWAARRGKSGPERFAGEKLP